MFAGGKNYLKGGDDRDARYMLYTPINGVRMADWNAQYIPLYLQEKRLENNRNHMTREAKKAAKEKANTQFLIKGKKILTNRTLEGIF